MHSKRSTTGLAEPRKSPLNGPVAIDDRGCVETSQPGTLPRCGRCVSWTGFRSRNIRDMTVSFAINGRCTNMQAPLDLAGRDVHYLDGANCPEFKHWKST